MCYGIQLHGDSFHDHSSTEQEIITITVGHPAILSLCDYLEKEVYTIRRMPVDKDGRLNLNAYKNLLSDQVAVASVMGAYNEKGTVFSVAEMAAMANAAGVMFDTDAVQAVDKISMMLQDTKIDLPSLSWHKLHARLKAICAPSKSATTGGSARFRLSATNLFLLIILTGRFLQLGGNVFC